MTVTSSTSKSRYTGNGVTTAFTGSFRILDEDHVTVTHTSTVGVDTVKTITTDYTVSGVGGSSFTVTHLVAPASGVIVTLSRNVPATQELDLVENDAMPANDLETAFDKATMLFQQADEAIDRSVRFPVSDSTSRTAELPVAALRAGKVLAFDADGDVIVSTEDLADIEDSITAAAASAAAAAASAAAASTAETNAETAEAAAEAAQAAAEAAAASVGVASETNTGVVELATQAEVTTGTDATRVVTPATLAGRDPALVTVDTGADEVFIRDATDGLEKLVAASAFGATAASQAEMETATSTSVFVTPGRQLHHPAHPKAWVNFNGTGTVAIRADYGVSSITDHNTGDYSVNFDVAFSSANYLAIGICDRTINTTHGTEGIQTVTFGTSAFRFICASQVPTATDQEYVGMAFWGDQ
jgi:hypothetical protein